MGRYWPERREHSRTPVDCAVSLATGRDETQAEARILNLSDGGAMLVAPVRQIPDLGQAVSMSIALPRSTPNTRMVEQVSVSATVVRHEAAFDDDLGFVAVRFRDAMDLDLEV